MQVVKDTIIKIEMWSRPLRRHTYSADELKWESGRSRHEGSGLLLDIVQERERQEEELYQKEQSAILEAQALESIPLSPIPDLAQEQVAEDEPKKIEKKSLFRNLNRGADGKAKITIFDYAEVELANKEKMIDKLINQDGYYDEVIPLDADEDFRVKPKFNKRIIVVLALTIGLLVGVILYVKSFF